MSLPINVNNLACPSCQKLSEDKTHIEKIFPLHYLKVRNGYYCENCNFLYPVVENIIVALPKTQIERTDLLKKICNFKKKHGDKNEKSIEGKYLTYSLYLQFKYYGEILQKLDHIDSESILFDLGCGGGAISKYCNTGKYIGLEIELNRLLVASLNKRQVFILGDLQHLPFQSNSINKFVCFGVIEHTQDYNLSMLNLKRVVCGSGLIVVPARDTFNFLDDPINFLRIKLGLAPSDFGHFAWGHMGMLSQNGWRDLIGCNEFEVASEGFMKVPFFAQCFNLFLYIIFYKKEFNDLPVGIVSEDIFKKVGILWGVVTRADFCFFRKHGIVEFFVKKRK